MDDIDISREAVERHAKRTGEALARVKAHYMTQGGHPSVVSRCETSLAMIALLRAALDRAEADKAAAVEACAQECDKVFKEAVSYKIAQMAMGAAACRDAIRALLTAPALPASPAVQALRDKVAQIIIADHLQILSDYDVDVDLYRHDPEAPETAYATADAIIAALSPFTGAKP